ncbi:thiol:disulfide interchange protein, partial [Paraburkholderia sp. SIMBA_050]
VLAGGLKMVLAALWLLVAAAALGLFTPHAGAASIWRRLGRGLGAALAIWAATLLVGLAAGSNDPVKPLAVLAARTVASGDASAAAQQ